MVLAAGAFMWVRTSASRGEAPPAALNRELFAFSLPLVPAGLALIVLSSSDMFMLRVMSPSLSESGYYEWASRVCLGLMPVILGFDMAWKRYIFRKKETGGTIAELGRAGLLFMLLVNWISMLLAMASPPIVAALGGGEFWPAVRVLPTLAGASAMYGLFLISQTGCLLTGQTKYVAWMTLFGAMLNIGFNMRLIPVAGALGAAFATIATNLFMALSLFWLGRKVFPISFLAVTLTVIPPLTFGPLATLGPGWRSAVVLAGSILTVAVIWLLRLMGTTLSTGHRE
jgi:O-antigen/teichoic acid export membrane protein